MNEDKKGIMRKNLRDYFNNNIVAYSYLFFAASFAFIIGSYISYAGKHPPTPSQIHSWQQGNTIILFLPLFFMLASIFTFDLSSLKFLGKIIAILINAFFFIIVFLYILITGMNLI